MEIQEIERKLSELPNSIYEAGKKALDAEKEYKLEELTFDVAFAQALVESTASSATQKKAEAVFITQPQKKALINSEWKKEKEVLYAKALRDQWDSVRKLANLEQERMRTQIN